MARINVYLPDDLAEAVRSADLNVSAVTQEALRQRLAARSTDAWLAKVARAAPPQRPSHEAVMAALDAARDEPPTYHG